MRRKEFMRMAAAAAAGAAAWPLIGSARPRSGESPWPAADPADESFWKFVRAQFPLSTDRAYFNTGGLGASPYAVIDAVVSKTMELERIGETGHDESLWTEIKTDCAALLGCDPGEIAFTRNTTEGINIVANGLPFKPGDEIITTTHEHVGNAFTWMVLGRRSGTVLKKFVPSTVSAQENIDRIASLMSRRTRLISVPHAVTTTGLILPVREIAAMARAKRVWSFVDGAQTAGMFPFSLHDIGCDAYATSGHKWLLGPKETGLLYVRKEMLDTIAAKFVGAYSDGGFDFLKGTFAFNPSAQRYEYGTVSTPLRVGLGTAVRFLRKIGMESVWARDRALAARLFGGLQQFPRIEVLSPADEALRSAMITFAHRDMPYMELQKHLTDHSLRTRAVGEGGLAALRISLHIYNMPEEVDRILEALKML